MQSTKVQAGISVRTPKDKLQQSFILLRNVGVNQYRTCKKKQSLYARQQSKISNSFPNLDPKAKPAFCVAQILCKPQDRIKKMLVVIQV